MTTHTEQKQFEGLPISSGKVAAKVCVYSRKTHNQVAVRVLKTDEEIRTEIERFEDVLSGCSGQLDTIAENVAKEIGESEAEIFIAQKHIMNDPIVVKQIKDKIQLERKNIEAAISEVFEDYEKKFADLDDTYFSDRSTDIGEIRRRLLDSLTNSMPGFECEGQEHCVKGKDRIIVAEELTADMTIHMNLDHVRGIITEHGGYASHAAIIARSVGVPAVSGVQGIYQRVQCGQTVLLDGDNGAVILDPDERTIKRLIPIDTIEPGDVCHHYSPEGVEVLANASLLDDVQLAVTVRADGIGLLRTEISFIRAERLLSEAEQFDFYAEVQRLLGDRPVTFRLLDVGGDKDLPFLSIAKEANPFLGMRGARFLLESKSIFSTQTKALLRLSKKGKVRILFPMVIDALQVKKLIEAVKEIMVTCDCEAGNVELGAMFEVPSACLQADSILKQVDFASIGSNDLIQYLFAVDRTNEFVSKDYNPEHPALWDVLKILSDAAERNRKPLSICGEMAGRQYMPSRLLGIGITSLSVSPRLIPRVRNEVSQLLETRAQNT